LKFDVVTVDPTEHVELPEVAKLDKLERVRLTGAEFAMLIDYGSTGRPHLQGQAGGPNEGRPQLRCASTPTCTLGSWRPTRTDHG